jgi:hypothetical protein
MPVPPKNKMTKNPKCIGIYYNKKNALDILSKLCNTDQYFEGVNKNVPIKC